MAACAGRADRTTGRRHSRSRSWEPPSMCRCRVPSAWPASAVGSCAGTGLWRMRQSVRYFDIRHPQFVERVLDEGLLLRTEIAFGLFTEHAERVDGLPRTDQI